MGMNKHVYVGPYVRFPAHSVVRELPAPGTCCGAERREAFCGKCGMAISPGSRTVTEDLVNVHEASQRIGEAMYSPLDASVGSLDVAGFHAWRPNKGRFGVDADEAGSFLLTEEFIAAEKRRFATTFAEELATLEGIYGERAQVVYGVLVWWS